MMLIMMLIMLDYVSCKILTLHDFFTICDLNWLFHFHDGKLQNLVVGEFKLVNMPISKHVLTNVQVFNSKIVTLSGWWSWSVKAHKAGSQPSIVSNIAIMDSVFFLNCGVWRVRKCNDCQQFNLTSLFPRKHNAI